MNGWRIGSLFSGIGGLELGLEQAGVGHTVFHVEADPYCQQVLGKRWPGVPCFSDVREVGAGILPECDVLVGGFPCQDISNAGKREGLEGDRSGLWFEFARLIGELRPRVVIVENVAALLVRGADQVLGEMAALGYDAQWGVVSAASVGAWHQRDRLFIVAADPSRVGATIPDAGRNGLLVGGVGPAEVSGLGEWSGLDVGPSSQEVPNPNGSGLEEQRGAESIRKKHSSPERFGEEVPDANGIPGLQTDSALDPLREVGETRDHVGRCSWDEGAGKHWWRSEPPVGRVADGVPSRVDRLRCLGNAVVPEVARSIGLGVIERGWL